MNKSECIFYKTQHLCDEDLGSSFLHYSPMAEIYVGIKNHSKWNNGISPETDLNLKLLNEGCGK